MTVRYRKILLVLDGKPTADQIMAVSLVHGVRIAEPAVVRSVGPCIAAVLVNTVRDDDFTASLAKVFASFRFVTSVVPVVDDMMDAIAGTTADHHFKSEIQSMLGKLRPQTLKGEVAQETLSEHLDTLSSWCRITDRILDEMSKDKRGPE
jgi:hypothetical protein